MHPHALLLVTLGALLLLGLLAKSLGRLTHVPGVTLMLLLGIAAGPVGLDLLPEQREAWFPLLARVALVSIGFLLGHEFTRSGMREHGRAVLVISAVVSLVTAGLVAGGLVLVGAPPDLALLLGAIASATAPAATVSVVQESRAEGPFAKTLLGIVAVDDVWALLLFAVTAPVAVLLGGGAGGGALAETALRELGGGVLLGLALGVPMAYLTGRLRVGEPTRLEAVGFILICAGLASVLDVSYLVAAVVMGATVANLARHHERAFDEIENFETPFLVIFFVLAGASLEVSALGGAGLVVVVYVLLRIAGRIAGAAAGARFAGLSAGTGGWLGAALLPQAGVALGLALAVQERLPAVGERLLPIVIVATVVFEIVGPLLTRTALKRVGEAAD